MISAIHRYSENPPDGSSDWAAKTEDDILDDGLDSGSGQTLDEIVDSQFFQRGELDGKLKIDNLTARPPTRR